MRGRQKDILMKNLFTIFEQVSKDFGPFCE